MKRIGVGVLAVALLMGVASASLAAGEPTEAAPDAVTTPPPDGEQPDDPCPNIVLAESSTRWRAGGTARLNGLDQPGVEILSVEQSECSEQKSATIVRRRVVVKTETQLAKGNRVYRINFLCGDRQTLKSVYFEIKRRRVRTALDPLGVEAWFDATRSHPCPPPN
jgi:hypothetical protein